MIDQTENSYLLNDEDACCGLETWKRNFATKWQVLAVVIYLFSQGFAIPIMAVGPSWAVWPRLDDFATVFLAIVYYLTRSRVYPMNSKERFVFIMWTLGILLSFPSMFLGRLMYPELGKGIFFGIFQTFRVAEYGLVWYCIRGMAFSQKQFDRIAKTVFYVMIFVFIIALGNATGIIPAAKLVSHLPRSASICGPWHYVHLRTGASRALGPYGWNAGYMAGQLTFMTAIMLAAQKPSSVVRIVMMAMTGCVIVISGARATLVGWFVAMLVWSYKSVKQMLLLLSLFILVVIGLVILENFTGDVFSVAMERAMSIVTGSDVTMSGRTLHWKHVIDVITNDPKIPLMGVGWGFGSHVLGGVGNAHMMILQAVLELGIFGAMIFFLFLFGIFRLLGGEDSLKRATKAVFIGMLVASLGGETFYPIASSGSFLGFTAAIVAISCAVERGRHVEQQLDEDIEYYDSEDVDEH